MYVFFVLLIGLMFPIQNWANADTHLCVQTINVYGTAYAANKPARMRALQGYFQNNPCDLVMAQEAWTNATVEPLSNVFSSQGFQLVNFNDPDTKPITLKTGLLSISKFPIIKSHREIFDHNFNTNGLVSPVENIRKGLQIHKALGITLHKVENSEIALANIHTHPQAQSIRLSQMLETIETLLPLLSRVPLVLGGDFNATPNSEELLVLKDLLLLEDSISGDGIDNESCTYCAENGHYWGWTAENRRIDYILSRRSNSYFLKLMASKIEPKIYSGIYVSDHYGVRTYFQLNAAEFHFVPNDQFHSRLTKAKRRLLQVMDIINKDSVKIPEMSEAFARGMRLYQRLKSSNESDPLIINLRLP